jgi:electron transport complex protein RnfD
MENKLIVSLSPHVHGGDSVQKNMYGVLIALIPAFIVSLVYFGLCTDCHSYFCDSLFVF